MKTQKILLIAAFSLYQWPLSAQTQLGQDITGTQEYDEAGRAIALSSDGTIMAIGIPNNDPGNQSGTAKVYRWNGSSWVQRGQTLVGTQAWYGNFGGSIALSSDGNILAIGDQTLDVQGHQDGAVYVYKWNGTEWVQYGNVIHGKKAADHAGWDISLSSDGNVLALSSALANIGSLRAAGTVSVYSLKSNTWTLTGNEISGTTTGEMLGYSISLSSDGKIIALSSNNKSRVKIFKWIDSTWVQKGNDISGESNNDGFGTSVSISSDGNILAIGAPSNNGNGNTAGHTRIFSWNETTWLQKGDDIDGDFAGDFAGVSVSLDADGEHLAIGVIGNDENGQDAGAVKLFKWAQNKWVQKGAYLYGISQGDRFGSEVVLSKNGKILAIGAPYFDKSRNDPNLSPMSNVGIVRTYAISACDLITKQPISRTATAGNHVQLILSADSGVSFQWQMNSGSGWSNLSNDSKFAGVTNDTLIVKNVSTSFSGYKLRCIASKDTCTSVSSIATLSVHCDLLNKNLANATVSNLRHTIFSVKAEEECKFQWQTHTDTGWIDLTDTFYYNGVKNDTLSISGIDSSLNNKKFRCILYTDSCSDTSSIGYLNVLVCSSGTFIWDGGGSDTSFFTKENLSGDVSPCPTSNAIFNNTTNKNCVIGDTLSLGDIITTTSYIGRIILGGKNTIMTVDDIDLKGNMLVVENQCGRITCDSLGISYNGYAETSGVGMDVTSLLYLRGSIFAARSNSLVRLRDFYLDRMGSFSSPSDKGIVSCTGNFTKEYISNFNPRNGHWKFEGDQSSYLDPGFGTNNPVRIQFHNLTISKTDSSTLSIANSDTIQVNGNFNLEGTLSRVQGGIMNFRGNITMGKAFQDGSFNKVLLTGIHNQTITCDTADEFSETVVIQKPSGKVLLGKDLNLKSVRFNSGILDPNGRMFTLTDNDIAGYNIQSNIKDRAYVYKTNGAFSGNSITVPLSNGDGLSLNSISLNTTGTHNDWQLDFIATNPTNLNSNIGSGLDSLYTRGYWRMQRLTKGTGSNEVFLELLANSSFNRVALLDSGNWRSIGGNVSGSHITSTENGLFSDTGTWYVTVGMTDNTTPNSILVSEDKISGHEIFLHHSTARNHREDIKPEKLFVFPNPVEQFLNIYLPQHASQFSIKDPSGRVIGTYNADQKTINVGHLSNGIYFLHVKVDERNYIQRFIKQ
jgi:hypothetical protein